MELFYWDKKEAVSLLQNKGLQLPKTLPQDGSIHSIHDKGSTVKAKFKNVVETQQFKRWFGDWQNNPKKASKIVNDDGTPTSIRRGDRRSSAFVLRYQTFFRTVEDACPYGFGGIPVSVRRGDRRSSVNFGRSTAFKKAFPHPTGSVEYQNLFVGALGGSPSTKDRTLTNNFQAAKACRSAHSR